MAKNLLILLYFLFIINATLAGEKLVIREISRPAILGVLKESSPRNPPIRFLSVDQSLIGLQYVYVPQANSKQPGAGFSFSVNQPVVVYLVVHPRGGYVPDGWKKTKLTTKWKVGEHIVTDQIYAKEFPAGIINIPPHTGMTQNNTKPPYGLGHCAIIQPAEEAKLKEIKASQEINISNMSKGAMLSNFPNRIIMNGISVIVPDNFNNSKFVCMPRGDSKSPGKGYSFTIDKDCDVYIAVNRRGVIDLNDWKKTSYSVVWSHSGNTNIDSLYRKHFIAGKVVIPENAGTNGNIYGIPHMAIIPEGTAPEVSIVSWDLQDMGLEPLTNTNSLNAKPVTKVIAKKTITLRIPANTINADKVYSLKFWAKNEKPSIINITSVPVSPQPFGNEFLVKNNWSKIVCPVVAKSDGLTLKLTIPEDTIIEQPLLYEDKTGILPDNNQIVKYLPGDEWKPVNMGKQDEIFQPIQKGTALDFSNIPTRIPAGEKGRIVINAQGKLAFEKDINRSLRFRSCGFPFNKNTDKAFTDNFIDNLITQGYNMVRFHGKTFRKDKYLRYGVTIENAKFIPQSHDDFATFFDEEKLRNFDYILSELGKHGIYVYFDIMQSFAGWTDAMQAGHWAGKDLLGKQFHAQLYVNKKFRQNWKAGITYLLNRTNTVNGIKWKDDPVFACLLFMNEQDFRVTPSYLSAFEAEWKKLYGKGAPELSEKLLKSDSDDGRKAGKFMQDKISDMNRFFIESIRAAGYKGLVTNWDLYMRMIDVPGWGAMDVASMHSYHGHPGMPREASSVPGFPVNTPYGKKEIAINTQSSINDMGKYFARIICKRNINGPAMIMEYGDTAPNPYRHEAGLFFSSYAALNGIDVLQPHGSVITNQIFTPLTPYLYSDYRDPIFRASDIINVFGFLRGDVETAKHNVEFIITPEILASANRLDSLSIEYTKTFLLTKVGMRYSDNSDRNNIGNVKADLEIIPNHFARAQGTSVEAVTTIETSQVPEIFWSIVNNLRKIGILSNNNKTNPDNDIYESETKQILFQPTAGSMQINTQRLEGIVIKDDKAVTINRLSIVHCTTPAAISLVSLDKNKTLENTGHLLLTISTNCVNTGMVTNSKGNRMLDIGTAPLLMKVGRFSVKLKNNKVKSPKVYSLNLDGTRAQEISAQQTENGLTLDVDTSLLTYCTPFFEVAY